MGDSEVETPGKKKKKKRKKAQKNLLETLSLNASYQSLSFVFTCHPLNLPIYIPDAMFGRVKNKKEGSVVREK